MSDNPFDRIINESLENINKLSRIKTAFRNKLSLASESLNNALNGIYKLDLRLNLGNVTPSSTISAMLFAMKMNNDDSKGFVFITNEVVGEIAAAWEVDESSDTIAISCNKVKNSYPSTEEGIMEAVSYILSQKYVLELAIKLKKNPM